MKKSSYAARALALVAMSVCTLIRGQYAYGERARHADLPCAAPETVGFSSERLKRLDAMLQRSIDEKQYAGVVALLARHGKVVYFEAKGKRELANGAPMEKDTIFRLASMTKPVTAAAMMLLYEEGKWQPQVPIAQYIPEFSHLKVSRKLEGAGRAGSDAEVSEDPAHAPTMRELMTHTAGFGGFGTRALNPDLYVGGSLQSMINELAKIPLTYQPSSRWVYSLSMDIQGYIIEKLSGTTLPEFMKQRLFEPLGMSDTGFYVPEEKRNRFAGLYGMSAEGKLIPTGKEVFQLPYDREPALPLGGGGLVATAADYFRFAQMLLNNGLLNGRRVLGESSVKLMMSNHLSEGLIEHYEGADYNCPRLGMGYGYNGAVVIDPGKADVPMGKGTYLWDGGYGTWFWADPVDDIVFIGMIQSSTWPDEKRALNLEESTRGVIYQALLKPSKVGDLSAPHNDPER